MIDISDRHMSDLGGRLSNASHNFPLSVNVIIEPRYSETYAVQHTAWMACNLLVRLQHVVDSVFITCDSEATLRENVIPLAVSGAVFVDELIAKLNSFGLTSARAGRGDCASIYIGPGNAAGIRAVADGWIGGLSSSGQLYEPSSALPIGPYLGACYAVAEIFRSFRLKNYVPSGAIFYDAYNGTHSLEFSPGTNETMCQPRLGAITLAGVGAVGSAWLHTLWAFPDLSMEATIVDPDPDGVESTNLNRYCLFGIADLKRKKASAAALLLSRDGIVIEPIDSSFEDITNPDDFIVCAVDKNVARQNIQNSYRPIMLMASTSDLRLEALRCTLPGINACIRCYNKPEQVESDEQLRARLSKFSEDKILETSDEFQIPVEEIKSYIETARCSEATERLRHEMRISDLESERRFAISFVSVASGVILAAETCKIALRSAAPLNGTANRITMQFFNPMINGGASRYLRDPSCPACRPSDALEIWKRRYQDHELNENDEAR